MMSKKRLLIDMLFHDGSDPKETTIVEISGRLRFYPNRTAALLKVLQKEGSIEHPTILVQHPSCKRKVRSFSLTEIGRDLAHSEYEAVRNKIVLVKDSNDNFRKVSIDKLSAELGFDVKMTGSILSHVRNNVLDIRILQNMPAPSGDFGLLLNQLKELVDRISGYIVSGRVSGNDFEEMLKIKDSFEIGVGNAFRFRAEYDKALVLLSSVLLSAKARKNWDVATKTLYQMGAVYSETNQLRQAVRSYTSSLQFAKKARDRATAGKVLMGMGGVYYKTGLIRKGLNYEKRALIALKQYGSKNDIATAYGNLAVLYQTVGNYRKSKELHEESLRLKDELGDKRGLALEYANLGDLKSICGEVQEGIKLLEESIRICNETGNKWLLTFNYCHMAEAHLKINEFEKALKNVKLAIALSESIGVKDTNIYARIVNAMIFTKTRKWKRAGRLLEGAIKDAREINVHTLVGEAYLTYGQLEMARRDIAASTKYLNIAMKLSGAKRLYNLRKRVKNELVALRRMK